MLPSLRSLPRPSWPAPERTSLGWWLIAIHVAIVLLVGGGITWSASGMLHDLADEQAQARVRLAAGIAREDLRRLSGNALAGARALAARPALERLASAGSRDALPPILARWCNADACAVLDDKTVVAVTGRAVDWPRILTAGAEQGQTFMALPDTERVPLLGAWAPLGGAPQLLRVYVVQRLGARLAASLARQVGAQVRLIDYRQYTSAPVSAFTPLYAAALADGHSAAQRIASQDVYAGCAPVFASSGEAIALIETLLPVGAVDTATGHLARRLLLTALALAALAVLAGVWLAQWVAAPVRALTQAAVRLGAGDFSASIPAGGAAEVGALARTMEDMRRNLIELTGTLRQREAEARAVLGGIVEGVYAVDRDRVIRYLNPQAARLLGVTPAAALGRFCGDVLRPRAVDGRRPCETHCPILEARTAGSARSVEHLDTGPGAPRTTVVNSAAPVEGLQVQVMRDETELEAVRRARDSVLANISHEFRTPLAAQLASIELLLAGLGTLPAERLKELVTSLERGTLRLTQLIDNLLESVRIESGQLAIRQQSVALAEVVAEARGLIGPLLAQRRQTLEESLPEDLPPLTGDKPRLTQVLVNLLANAGKFAPEGSVVRVGAAAHGAQLLLWVEDEGPGPTGTDTDGLFAPFRRGPGTGREPEPAGLGLGLSIVKSIVDRHRGAVSAERTAAGRTRFTVTLPADQPA